MNNASATIVGALILGLAIVAGGYLVSSSLDRTSARLGDNVWVVSFPWGRRGTVVNGFVSQITDAWSSVPLPLEGPAGLIDAAVSYGTSGGGV